MKFEKYDIVQKSDGSKYVITEVSREYGDIYGYAIRSLETGGTTAWHYEDEFCYVEHADKDILKELDKVYEEYVNHKRDINYIMNNFPNISSISWLKLFEEIKYDCSFNRNGEYIFLFGDAQQLYPVFQNVFNNDLESAIDCVHKVFKTSYTEEYVKNVTEFFNKVQKIKNNKGVYK